MSVPVRDVARYIIQSSDRISNLKLQKLLYYVQGWHLGIKDTVLFPDRIEAWIHGPVVPSIFQQYRVFRWQTIPKSSDAIVMPKAEARHIANVLRAYDKYAGDQLERLSHSESPWIKARKGLSDSEPSNAVITPQSMREFFGPKSKA